MKKTCDGCSYVYQQGPRCGSLFTWANSDEARLNWQPMTQLDTLNGSESESISPTTIEDRIDTVGTQKQDILGTTRDMVTSPDHYTQMWPGNIETIDVIGAVLEYIDTRTDGDTTPRQLHCLGCMLKYLFRAPFKDNEAQDLEKAIAYIKLGGWNV